MHDTVRGDAPRRPHCHIFVRLRSSDLVAVDAVDHTSTTLPCRHSGAGNVSIGEELGPRSASNRAPCMVSGQVCPGSEWEGPARVAECLHERRSGGRGRDLFAHRGKPGWYALSGAVLKAPTLVAGFDDVAVMSQPIQQRGCHFGIPEPYRLPPSVTGWCPTSR